MIQTPTTDINAAVVKGQSDIQTSIGKSLEEIATAKKDLPELQADIQQLQKDVHTYRQVDVHIKKLQSDLLTLKQDVDLGSAKLKVGELEVTGSGPSGFSLGRTGCNLKDIAQHPISLCAQVPPLAFTSVTLDGRKRPVASYSPIGFQDISTSPKPICDEFSRGTIYIEKRTYS